MKSLLFKQMEITLIHLFNFIFNLYAVKNLVLGSVFLYRYIAACIDVKGINHKKLDHRALKTINSHRLRV